MLIEKKLQDQKATLFYIIMTPPIQINPSMVTVHITIIFCFICDHVTGGEVSAEMPRLPSHQTHSPAPLG